MMKKARDAKARKAGKSFIIERTETLQIGSLDELRNFSHRISDELYRLEMQKDNVIQAIKDLQREKEAVDNLIRDIENSEQA